MDAVNVDVMLARFTEHWVAEEDSPDHDYDVRIVKLGCWMQETGVLAAIARP